MSNEDEYVLKENILYVMYPKSVFTVSCGA